MNEFNVLLNAATNGTPSGSLFDALFARYIAPQESWRELESPLPITILAAGEALTDYKLYGNTVGGESVGERTENLFDINNLYSTVVIQGQTFTKPASAYFFDVFSGTSGANIPMNLQKSIPVTSGTYMLSFEESETRIAVLFSDGETQKAVSTSSSVKVRTFDITSDGYISIRCENSGVCSVKKLQIVKASTAPTSYIPFGYKLPMGTRSGNMFDKSFEQGYYGAGDGVKGNSPRYVRSNDTIPVSSDESYTVTYICPKEGTPQSGVGTDSYIYFWAADSSYIGYQQIMEKGNQTFVTPSNAAYMAFTIGAGSGGSGTLSPSDVSNFMLNSGAAALPYQPYSHTDIPIYIGDTPLAEDEYVDYGTQKIYKDIDGTLTPTDPPVPIPALPTIEGETIIDYNPSTTPAVEPEKMYVKYKPQ